MSKSSYSIFDFLRNCGGNWRNTVCVTCDYCIKPCGAELRGCLMTADSYGRPRLVSIARFESITGQRVDPASCAGKLTRYAFQDVFRDFSVWECDEIGECLLCHLDGEVTAQPERSPSPDISVPPSEYVTQERGTVRGPFRAKSRGVKE